MAVPTVKRPEPETASTTERVKADPAIIAKARELRDRWMDHVNAHPQAIAPAGKYDPVRAIESSTGQRVRRLAA